MELLAPAGNRKNFMAALEAGANAIYLGGKAFNARAKASNFSLEELKELIKIAHMLNVAVYVTVNIIIADNEIKELEEYLRQLDEIGVDAIIVQDLAVLQIARRVAKRMEIHGSTQMTATNLATVNYLYEQGMTRVVLSRELSLEEIKYICQNTKAEIEVFIHGALCICYSGQCLMSSFIGGRSGNRGACAQPCRLPYELVDENGNIITKKEENYIMSPKDLNYAEYIDELREAGVVSLKVEGRMKKVSYVREVIGAYRKIIDQSGRKAENIRQLESGFNRGFSTDYLLDDIGRKMMTISAPNNQGKEIGQARNKGNEYILTLEQKLAEGDLVKIISKEGIVRYETVDKNWRMEEIADKFSCRVKSQEKPISGIVYLAASGSSEIEHSDLAHFERKIAVDVYLNGVENEQVSCTLVASNGEVVTVYNEYELQKAKKTPTSIEKAADQMGRLGNTLFVLDNISIPEGDYMWPASVLNQLRRDAVEALENVLIENYESKRKQLPDYTQIEKAEIKLDKLAKDNMKIAVRVDEITGVEAAVEAGANTIIFGGDRWQRLPYQKSIYEKVVQYCKKNNVECVFTTPRIVKASEELAYKNEFKAMVEANPSAISLNFLGALLWLKEFNYQGKIYADTSLNTFNAVAVKTLLENNIEQIALSEEMTMQQIKTIAKSLQKTAVDLEILVHGKVEMMVSEYCVINAFAGIGCKKNCPMPCRSKKYYLKDRKGELFPIRNDQYCRMHILNAKELDMRPYMNEIMRTGVNTIRIEARGQEKEYIKNIVKDYRDILNGSGKSYPKTGDGITRGHYFKGIL